MRRLFTLVAMIAAAFSITVATAGAGGQSATGDLNTVAAWGGSCTNYTPGPVAGSVSITPLPTHAHFSYSLGVTLTGGAPDTTYNVWVSYAQSATSCFWIGNTPVGQITTDENGVGEFDFGYDATAGQNYVFELDDANNTYHLFAGSAVAPS